MKFPKKRRRSPRRGQHSFEGQLLIAMPSMTDRRFARSVVYVCAHSDRGAMGLIINQRADHISFTELLEHLEIARPAGSRRAAKKQNYVHVGGPVETARGFVLHSADYIAETSTLAIDKGICLTSTVDIVRAIARGDGPSRSLLALGYASWSPGQLESEFQANGWLHCAADLDLIFETDLGIKYDLAMARLGINPGFLISEAGHA
jgi:putative transcriptional regulator